MSRKPSIFIKRFFKTYSSPQSKKNLRVFVICLLISSIAWGFIKISDDYIVDFEVPVLFYNASQGETISSQSHQHVTYKLQANGIKILANRLLPRMDILSMDVRQAPRITRNDQSWAYFTNNQLRLAISEFFPGGQGIVSVFPDTVFVLLGKASERKVPVRVNSDLSFRKDFGLVGNIAAYPDSIYIKGPKHVVDTIGFIQTEVLKLEDLSAGINTQLQLSNPASGSLIHLSASTVMVSLAVEEFTETVVDLPVKVRYEEGYQERPLNIKLFPERVRVVCLIPLGAFASFDQKSLEAYVLVTSKIREFPSLEVRVESFIPDVKIQSILPSLVEAIILED